MKSKTSNYKIKENEPIVLVSPTKKERKQSAFIHKFVHEGKEYTVTTTVIKGGRDFILQDKTSVRDLSDAPKVPSPSEMAKMTHLIHNQCSFGELDTVSNLIEAKGVSPNVVDEVCNTTQ